MSVILAACLAVRYSETDGCIDDLFWLGKNSRYDSDIEKLHLVGGCVAIGKVLQDA